MELMNITYSVARSLNRFYGVKKKTIPYFKKYLLKYHIYPIIKEIADIKIHEKEFVTLKEAILSDSFNGLITHFLHPNDYKLNAKDIAVSLYVGAQGYSDNLILNSSVIDSSLYLTKKIKELFEFDEILKYNLSQFGKDTSYIDTTVERKKINDAFNDKKILFTEYFNRYSSEGYSETMTVYYPGNGKSWVDYIEDESLKVSLFKHDIPRGFFLMGLDYYSEKSGWLKTAIQTKENEYFNPISSYKDNIIWQL